MLRAIESCHVYLTKIAKGRKLTLVGREIRRVGHMTLKIGNV